MNRARSGLVLLVVLGLVLALTLVVAATAQAQRVELRLAGRFRDQVTARTAAQAGLELAIAAAAAQARGEEPDELAWSHDLGGARCALLVPPEAIPGIQVEDARLNLNAADAQAIALLPGMDLALAGRLVEVRREQNRAQGRIDPAEWPDDRPWPTWIDRPFATLAAAAAAVPACAAALADPRLAAATTLHSSGRIDVGHAGAAAIAALGVEAERARTLAGRRWARREDFLAAAGLADSPRLKRLVAVRPAAWRALALGTSRDGAIEVEALLGAGPGRIRVVEAHQRERRPGVPPAWVLP